MANWSSVYISNVLSPEMAGPWLLARILRSPICIRSSCFDDGMQLDCMCNLYVSGDTGSALGHGLRC